MPALPPITRRQWLSWAVLSVGVGCKGSPPSAPTGSSTAAAGNGASALSNRTPALGSSNRAADPGAANGASAPGAAMASAAPAQPNGAEAQPAPGSSNAQSPPLTIALLPLGEQLPEAQVALVQTALQAFYRCEVQLLPRLALPQSAYTEARKRYRAERLLDTLVEQKPERASRILGITAVDISTTKGGVADWGILGLATIDGTACVISTFRTKRGAKNDEHAAQRFAKTAVHEIGHTFGLEHCPTYGCLMEDGKGSVFTTDHEYELCSECRSKLVQNGVPLTEPVVAPWPRVN